MACFCTGQPRLVPAAAEYCERVTDVTTSEGQHDLFEVADTVDTETSELDQSITTDIDDPDTDFASDPLLAGGRGGMYAQRRRGNDHAAVLTQLALMEERLRDLTGQVRGSCHTSKTRAKQRTSDSFTEKTN
ncbi:unnamed protein product, partial [Prorocentrum cordatum]